MKVIILVAGKGTRFLPLSDTVPKPLIPVGGAPVLSHILRSLKDVTYDELILVTGHLSDQIEAFVKETHKGPVRIVPQRALDGTGGAVYAAKDHIDGPVLIIFGDTIFDADLSGLNAPDAGNRIWTRAVEDYQRFGIVQKDTAGNMAQIVEKPQTDVGRQANIGLYFIQDHQALLAGLDHVMAGASIGGEFFFTYALNHMVEAGYPIAVRDVDGWHDCGTLEAILNTNAHLLTCADAPPPPLIDGVTLVPPVRIDPTAQVQNATLGPNVTIGPDTKIANAKISHAIIDGNCDLNAVEIDRSLVGRDQILTNTKIEGAIIAHGSARKAT